MKTLLEFLKIFVRTLSHNFTTKNSFTKAFPLAKQECMEHMTAFESRWDFLTSTTEVLSSHFVFSLAANLHNILIMTVSTSSCCAAMFLKTQVLFQNRFIIEITKCGGTEPVSSFAPVLLSLPLPGNSFIIFVKIHYFYENTFMKEYLLKTIFLKLRSLPLKSL